MSMFPGGGGAAAGNSSRAASAVAAENSSSPAPASASRNLPSSLVSAFGELIGEKRVSSTRPLLRYLSGDYDPTPKHTFYKTTNQGGTAPYESFPASPTFLQEWISNLPYLHLEEKINSSGSSLVSVQYKEFSGSLKMTNSLKVAAKGSYGVVYKGSAGMYKLLHFEYRSKIPTVILSRYPNQREDITEADKTEEYESFLKMLLLEGFIQKCLSIDEQMGHRVCGIHRIFRDSSVIRTSIVSPSFYYSLEPIPYTVKHYIEYISDPEYAPNFLKHISRMLLQIEEMLTYFKSKYGFCHNDLHIGNILFTDAFEPKLIDFGRASIVVNGVNYSEDKDPREVSYDLLIFVTSLYVHCRSYFPADVEEAFRLFFQEGSFDLLKELEKRKYAAGIVDITHCMYPDYIESGYPRTVWNLNFQENDWSNPVILRYLDPTKNILMRCFDSNQFREYWGQFVKEGDSSTVGLDSPMLGGKKTRPRAQKKTKRVQRNRKNTKRNDRRKV